MNTIEVIETKHYFIANGVKVHWDFKLLPEGFEAITLFGHVFDVKNKDRLRQFIQTRTGQVMLNHERIHILQAQSFKLGYFSFYVIYLWYWIKGLFKYKFNSNTSYYNIPFEREAYVCELDFDFDKSHWKCYIEDPEGA